MGGVGALLDVLRGGGSLGGGPLSAYIKMWNVNLMLYRKKSMCNCLVWGDLSSVANRTFIMA